MADPKRLMQEFSVKKNLRSNHEKIWEDVDQYLYGFVGNYDNNPLSGQISYENIYNQAPRIFHTDATNALVGILWQQGGRAVKITKTDNITDSDEVSEWFKKANKKYIQVLDDPNARFTTTLTQYMDDALARGGSGVGFYRGTKAPLLFKNHPQRFLYYQEDQDGSTNDLVLRAWMPAYAVVDKYGAENVSPKTLKLANSATQSSSEIEIQQFVKPNEGIDAAEKPFLSIHLEVDQKLIVKDSFYEEQQIIVGRIYKNNFEVYGRSPAMDTIQSIKRLNSITGDTHIGVQRAVAPAIGMIAKPTEGIVDLTADAVNQFNTEGIEGTNPIFPLNVVGDLKAGEFLIEQLERDISNAYHINKLIDLNNDTEMTATEALIIDRIRNTSLGSLLSRQINELMTPVIEGGFSLLFNDNFFGFLSGDKRIQIEQAKAALKGEAFELETVPEAIKEAYLAGEPIFKVEYLTPAARLLSSEEANNIVETNRTLGEMAQVRPEVLDNYDVDEAARRFVELKGLGDLLETPNEVKGVREERQKMQEEQMKLDQATQAAQIGEEGGV